MGIFSSIKSYLIKLHFVRCGYLKKGYRKYRLTQPYSDGEMIISIHDDSMKYMSEWSNRLQEVKEYYVILDKQED